MTSNQVAFLQVQEGARHNLAYEEEVHRNNVAQLDEIKRHNKATEGLTGDANLINKMAQQETTRHNQVLEGVQDYLAQESHRHNVESEELTSQTLAESIRHNMATEGIQIINANAALISSQANQQNAETNALNATTRVKELNEATRHNQYQERINQSSLDESKRHNLAFEANQSLGTTYNYILGSEKNALLKQNNIETERHNKASEYLKGAEVAIKGFETASSVINDSVNTAFKIGAVAAVK